MIIWYTKEQSLTLESLFGQNNYPDVLLLSLNSKAKNIDVSLDYTYIKLN